MHLSKRRARRLCPTFLSAHLSPMSSFVLPISNPANLVVYGRNLPPLLPWLRTFLIPSLCSIVATYVALRWTVRNELEGKIEDGSEPAELSREGRMAAWGILGTGAILIAASGFGLDLGLPTCVSAILAVLVTTRGSSRATGQIVKGVSWSVIPLVAGLFVLVESLNHAGALTDVGGVLQWCAGIPRLAGALTASFGIAALSNVMNNLPSGLLAGSALQIVSSPAHIRDAVLIGTDLGPNLSVTGSLATVLWMVCLRREGERMSAADKPS